MERQMLLDIAKQTGIDIVQDGDLIAWIGPYGGKNKPNIPDIFEKRRIRDDNT